MPNLLKILFSCVVCCGTSNHKIMRMMFASFSVIASLTLMCAPGLSADAFLPDKANTRTRFPFLLARRLLSPRRSQDDDKQQSNFKHQDTKRSTSALSCSATVSEVKTSPIPGMKPGTSGLRKKVEVWQGTDPDSPNKNYLANFIQSLLDAAKARNNGETPQT